MSIDPIAVLEAIVAEVAGAGQPFSADSYLPAHMIHDARQAIEAEHKDAAEWKAREAHEALLLARLAKADEMIASLRAEIDALRRPNLPGQPDTTKHEWEEDVVRLRGPKQSWMTVAEPVKHDPDACAESVRDMKECYA